MKAWLEAALRRDVVRRSLRVSATVGTILVLVNFYDRIPGGPFGPRDAVKALLTYLVPYCVSTWVSVGMILERRNAG
jgi:hypothetical protein